MIQNQVPRGKYTQSESEQRLRPTKKNTVDRIISEKNADKHLLTGENAPINIFKQKESSRDSINDKVGYGPQAAKSSIFLNCEFSTPNCSQIEEYSLGHLIGKGAYAEVKECIHKKSGERVAIKQYDRYKLLDLQRKKQAIREIKILSKLEHSNIIKLHESIDTAKYVYLVMEYARGESLHSHLKSMPNR